MDKEDWSAVLFVLLMVFLFSGDPDIWDHLADFVKAWLKAHS